MNITIPDSVCFVQHEAHATRQCVTVCDELKRLEKSVSTLSGLDVKLSGAMVPIVSTSAIRYPSRHLRVLVKDSASERMRSERHTLVALMPWLTDAPYIICVNPDRTDGEDNLRHAVTQLFVAKPRPRKHGQSIARWRENRKTRLADTRLELGLSST